MNINVTNLSFDASEKKVTFSDYAVAGIIRKRLKLIINITDNIIVMNVAEEGMGCTVDGNVVTLTYDTTSMSDTDELMAIYDDPDAALRIINAALHAGEDLSKKITTTHPKPVSGQEHAPSFYTPATTNVSKDYIKDAPGNLCRFYIESIDTSRKLWVHFFDRISAPTNGLIPRFRKSLGPAASVNAPTIREFFFKFGGIWFPTGIAYGISSTYDTFTDAGSGTNYIIDADYT